MKRIFGIVCCLALGADGVLAEESVARQWNEQCLDAIRRDFPAPTVHARNLYHASTAMYDAWAAYDTTAVGVFHNEAASATDTAAARDEAVSYAGYRVLRARYANAVGAATTLAALDARMATLGYPISETTTTGSSPAAVGNRCAAAVLARTAADGSNEENAYVDNTGYAPVNEPLILAASGTGLLAQPNRWQPLAFEFALTQNGQVASKIQIFVGSHWGYVTPFALSGAFSEGVYANSDPGAPPYLGGVGDEAFKADGVEVIRYSSMLDPASPEMIDISPGATGNNTLGANDGTGHALNPATGQPYAPNPVRLADFGRVLAEFWADGPASETPPGHWNTIANQVSDTPGFEKRFKGTGPVLEDLEWDVKMYFALNAALHDAAVAAWGVKARYDYVRPITGIRHMGGLGQSSDPDLQSYHPNGLPLIPGLIEIVTPETAAPGGRHAGIFPRTIVIRSWLGEPASSSEVGGVGWIRATSWKPYQQSTFVTPAFAGYVSGHSTFSRAGAEVLTSITGNPYFPGGLATHTAAPGSLEFEYGPSSAVQLQWATYYDAADQAGLSRLYGGIHFAADDGPGRIIGSKVGKAAFREALSYIDGSVLQDFTSDISLSGTVRRISWRSLPGYQYKVQWSETLDDADFKDLTTFQSHTTKEASVMDATTPTTSRFYRVVRRPRP